MLGISYNTTEEQSVFYFMTLELCDLCNGALKTRTTMQRLRVGHIKLY